MADGAPTKATACCELCKQPDDRTATRPGPGRYVRSVANYRIPDVPLIDAEGRRVGLASVLDHDGPVMLQFVFTTCPTICPTLTSTFAAVQEALGADREKTRMISITIDPEYDRPDRLERYARSHRAGPEWRFYTGRAEDVAAVRKAFDAFQANKMAHEPLTLMRPCRDAPWTRLNGLLSASELAAEYRRMVAP
jgi:protein SCO1/2